MKTEIVFKITVIYQGVKRNLWVDNKEQIIRAIAWLQDPDLFKHNSNHDLSSICKQLEGKTLQECREYVQAQALLFQLTHS